MKKFLLILKKKPEPVITALESVEVYDAITVADFIIESEAEIVNGNDLLDTSQTGEFEISVSYLQDGAVFEKKMSYVVEDTEMPLILNTGWNPYHKTGTAFDLNDYGSGLPIIMTAVPFSLMKAELIPIRQAIIR